jgi:hypothetical protein
MKAWAFTNTLDHAASWDNEKKAWAKHEPPKAALPMFDANNYLDRGLNEAALYCTAQCLADSFARTLAIADLFDVRLARADTLAKLRQALFPE